LRRPRRHRGAPRALGGTARPAAADRPQRLPRPAPGRRPRLDTVGLLQLLLLPRRAAARAAAGQADPLGADSELAWQLLVALRRAGRQSLAAAGPGPFAGRH